MSAGTAIGYLGAQLVNPDSAGPGAITADDFVAIMRDIEYRFSLVADVFDNMDQQANASVTAATGAATQIEVIGQDVKDTTERIVQTIIPHSMAWLSGYIVSHFITQLQQSVKELQSNVSFLMGWRNQIDAWRNEFVDPNVELWVGFRQFFDGWPQGILFRWKDYFDNPDHFAQWAAAPLIGPLVSYLAAPEHKQTRDNLTDIIAKAWAEESEDILQSVYAFLLADT
jgi:hypothetical protein